MAFHDVVFPEDYSQGAVGGPGFRTTVVSTGSGHEQRNADWASARCRWDLSRLLYSPAARDATIEFFRARRGRAHSFLFKDWNDFYVGMAYSGNVLGHTGAHDFAEGDGSEVDFPLYKVYESGGYEERRRITRPKSAIKVYLDSAEQDPGDYTVDYSTGIVTFDTAPADGAVIGWSGEFYAPVRFDTDDLPVEYLAATSGNVSLPIVEVRE